MTDKPPVCLECSGTYFKEKPVELWIKRDKRFNLEPFPAFECEQCRTPIMNTEQMDTLRHLLDRTDTKRKY